MSIQNNKIYNIILSSADSLGLNLLKILLPLMLLIAFWLDYLLYYDFLWGKDAILSYELVAENYLITLISLFNFVPFSSEVFHIVIILYSVSLVLIFYGKYSNILSFCALVLLISIQSISPYILNSGDTVMRMLLFLMVIQSSKSFCIGLPNKIKLEKHKGVCWAGFMIPLLMAGIYISTVICKLGGGMWIDGTATYYTSRLESFQRVNLGFIFDNLFLIKLSTWGTLVVEFGAGVLLLISRFRIYGILLGVALHIGIEVLMDIPYFEWVMIVGLLGCLRQKDINFLMNDYITISRKLIPSR